jgi:GNAT superfamily N-acetyltransferase
MNTDEKPQNREGVFVILIRAAEASDAALILSFVRALAKYEKLQHAAVASEQDLLRDGFPAAGSEPRFRCLIAEWNGTPAGFALYFYSYSTFQGRAGIWLEDLFVKPEFRGKGIGKSLLLEVARIAVRENCGRYSWQVLDWNKPSIEFYQSLGAKLMSEWLTMRVEGEALEKLAALAKAAQAHD